MKDMPSGNTRKPVKATLPWELYMALIRIQGEEGLTWDEACIKASTYLGSGREEYAKAVDREAQNMYKSRHMTEMNKSRKKWIDEGYVKGVEEYRIVYPCAICNGDIVLRPGKKDHEAMKSLMRQAGWAHSSCLEK